MSQNKQLRENVGDGIRLSVPCSMEVAAIQSGSALRALGLFICPGRSPRPSSQFNAQARPPARKARLLIASHRLLDRAELADFPKLGPRDTRGIPASSSDLRL